MATKTNTEINGKQYFRITRTVGHTVVDGKRIPIKKQFYGTSKGNAEAQYKQYLKDEAEAKYAKRAELETATLHDRAEQFISSVLDVSSKYASGTKIRYRSAYYKHIAGSWLDQMPVKDIRPADVQHFYNDLDVTMSTLKQANRFMSALYKWMAGNEYANNVIPSVELPIKTDNKRHEGIVVWDDVDWDLLTNSKFDFRHDFLIKLMCYTGMRIGECLGLKYSDIRDNTIHVMRQYSMGEIKPPKYGSRRDIPMHSKLVDALTVHREWHEKEMKKNGYQTDFVFTTASGKLCDVTNLHTAFRRFYDRIGIEHPLHFHAYRATFCTKLCEAGAPIEVASKILGHKSLEVTAAHYALVRPATKQSAIDLLK